MEAFRVNKHIQSTTINIPEFQKYIGRHAEIIILIENRTELKSHFIFEDEKSTKKGITAKDILQLPIDQRESVIAKQFKDAIELYNDNPELIIEDVDSFVEYGDEI
ncbi:MAG: hypothetical protein OMM_09961 [Candidatus Magnetoglobus multicellularis str. Araruama]|uniref:Uncharacterized protein n=1 Tax=Candidatus Magnetoglobus multicellularis str. Araruama TaxID=890399 RepID=A0A1V1P2J1_9BACT|nr:MAG: hypothetical protein OMM_09961 [Candidatus Magnetoglobus multicellularis str. Araruama]